MNVNALFTCLGTCFFYGIFFHIVHDKKKLFMIITTSTIIKVKNCETHTRKNNHNHIGTIELTSLTTQLYAPF